MSWTEIQHVPVGSLIDVRGQERKVLKNNFGDLIVGVPGSSTIGESLKAIYDRAGDDWDGPKQKVFAKQAQSVSTSSLKQQLEAAFAPQVDPAADLRKKIEASFGEKATIVQAVPAPSNEWKDAIHKLEDKLSGVARQANSAFYTSEGAVLQYEQFADEVEEVTEKIEDLEYEVNSNYSELSRRVSSLEHDSLQKKLNQRLAEQKQTKNQGGISMSIKNLIGTFSNAFGKVEGQFALSPAGLAIRKNPNSPAAQWVAYDTNTGVLTDVQGMVLDFNVPAFSLPTVADQVKEGDIVVNNGKYQYVVAVNDDYLTTVSPADGARGSVLPVKNLVFNKSFYTVVKTLDLAGKEGFDPMLLLAMGKGDKSEILPLLLMTGGLGGQGKAGAIDPMLLAFAGDNMDEILPFILMQQGGVAPQGLNPLMLLAMSDKGGKGNDILPLLAMTGGLGGAQGAEGLQGILPFLLLGDKGGNGGGDLKDILMIQALSGQNGFAGLFGGAAPKAEVAAPQVTAQPATKPDATK